MQIEFCLMEPTQEGVELIDHAAGAATSCYIDLDIGSQMYVVSFPNGAIMILKSSFCETTLSCDHL